MAESSSSSSREESNSDNEHGYQRHVRNERNSDGDIVEIGPQPMSSSLAFSSPLAMSLVASSPSYIHHRSFLQRNQQTFRLDSTQDHRERDQLLSPRDVRDVGGTQGFSSPASGGTTAPLSACPSTFRHGQIRDSIGIPLHPTCVQERHQMSIQDRRLQLLLDVIESAQRIMQDDNADDEASSATPNDDT